MESGSQPDDENLSRMEPLDTAGLRTMVHYLRQTSGVTLWKASDAADAIEQMLEALIKIAARGHIAGQQIQVPRTRQYPRLIEGLDLCDLSNEDLDRLRLLDQKLAGAEAWIRQRRDRCMRDYFNAGGIQRFTSFRLGPAPYGDGLHRRLATTSVCRRASGPECTVAVRSI